MISLDKYIEECGEIATPSNTIGMGDIQLPDNSIGADGLPPSKIPSKKKIKKKDVKESILDGEKFYMDKMDDQIKTIKWLAEHINHDYDTEEAMELINKNIKFNNDGSFDLPECSFLGIKSYTFNIDEELPSYVKFNNLGNKLNIFEITSKRDIFHTTGFPKKFITSAKVYGNCTINAQKVSTLFIETGTINECDLLIINTTANDVWMDKNAAILNAELNTLNRKCINSHTIFHNIPFHIYNLNISKLGLEYILKDRGIISWSSNLIKK